MPPLQWSGIITGLITPFRSDGEIDWDSLERHLAYISRAGITGVLTSAMMGEGGHLSLAEREAILRFTVSRVGDELPVIATIYGNNTRDAAEEANRAVKIGARALLVFPHPAFAGRPLEPELPAAYFQQIWDAARTPMIVFRTPESLAPKFGLDVLQKLIDVPGVAAIKDSAAERDFYTGSALKFLRDNSAVKILIDCDPHIPEFMRLGADGATSICAAVFPEEYVRLLDPTHMNVAEDLIELMRPFAEAVFSSPFRDFRARLKCALEFKQIISSGRVRAPLLPLLGSQRENLENIVRQVDGRPKGRSQAA
jgi:4-hydroxy-tetrahydrodipicolinate synthase